MDIKTEATEPIPCYVQIGFVGPQETPQMELARKILANEEVKQEFAKKFAQLLSTTDADSEIRTKLGIEFARNHKIVGVMRSAGAFEKSIADRCQQSGVVRRLLNFAEPDATTKNGSSISEIVENIESGPDQEKKANLRILELADIAIAVTINGEADEVVTHFEENARRRKLPFIRVTLSADSEASTVSVTEAEPGRAIYPVYRTFAEEMIYRFVRIFSRREDGSQIANLPNSIREISLSPSDAVEPAKIFEAIKSPMSTKAAKWRDWFQNAVIYTIVAHIFATMLGIGAQLQGPTTLGIFLLIVEGLLLLFAVSLAIISERTPQGWGESRVIAEICRFLLAAQGFRTDLQRLRALWFPDRILPAIKTLEILKLQHQGDVVKDFNEVRTEYVENRAERQLFYLRGKVEKVTIQRRRFRRLYFLCWGVALASVSYLVWRYCGGAKTTNFLNAVSFLGEVLPAMAFGIVTYISAADLSTIKETYRENIQFLDYQIPIIKDCDEFEFQDLVFETEEHLLGENIAWYYRNAFQTV